MLSQDTLELPIHPKKPPSVSPTTAPVLWLTKEFPLLRKKKKEKTLPPCKANRLNAMSRDPTLNCRDLLERNSESNVLRTVLNTREVKSLEA